MFILKCALKLVEEIILCFSSCQTAHKQSTVEHTKAKPPLY